MAWIRAFATIVLAAGIVLAGLPASAQSTPPAGKVKREKVDVRTMVPGPHASDAASEARPVGGLTRDQRKEATLQARQEGTLQPAGDAAEPRDDGPAPLASNRGAVRPAVSEATVPAPPGDATLEAQADAPGATKTATAVPTSTPTKKSSRKKARSASGATPV